jgi:hypothetical protein
MNQILPLPCRRVTVLRSTRAGLRYLQSPYRIIREFSSHSSNDGNEQEGKDINARSEESEPLGAIHSESTEYVAGNSEPGVQHSPEASTSASPLGSLMSPQTGPRIYRAGFQRTRPSKQRWYLRRVVAERLKELESGFEPGMRKANLYFPSPRQFTIICPNPKLTVSVIESFRPTTLAYIL